jgi:outer membrane protein assembly factor BamB
VVVVSRGTGSAGETIINTTNMWTLGEAWNVSTGGAIESSPAVDHVRRHAAFVGSDDGNLYAFNALDGTTLWTGPTGGPVRSSPAIDGNVVYVGSDDGKVYAFDADGTGCAGAPKVCDPLWTASTGGAVASSPAVVGGIVYVGSNDGTVYALNAIDGSTVWSADAACVGTASTTCAMATPAVVDGIVFIGSDEGDGLNESGALYAFDAATGTPLWTAHPGIIQSSPAVADNTVFVSAATITQIDPEAATDTLYAYDSTSGDLLLTATVGTGRGLQSPTIIPYTGYPKGLISIGSAAVGGVGAVFDGAGSVDCSGTPAQCTPIRATPLTSPAISSSATANGVTYTSTVDGELLLFTDISEICPPLPDPCLPTRTLPLGAPSRSSPAIAAGWIYVGTDDGHLHAFHTYPPG